MVRLSLGSLNIGFEQSLLPTFSKISEDKDTFTSIISLVFLTTTSVNCIIIYTLPRFKMFQEYASFKVSRRSFLRPSSLMKMTLSPALSRPPGLCLELSTCMTNKRTEMHSASEECILCSETFSILGTSQGHPELPRPGKPSPQTRLIRSHSAKAHLLPATTPRSWENLLKSSMKTH